eukprot:TRINITY_DN17716_c0_g1_i1.p1 TRINITY_DN17716_c0_g1~~TRINITY_DN17716_c0_g1_i1.p1  ORF type:complete len:191 (-),score=46.19 TRINITY_DN17716_c0_g1_i1:116-688(-)
MLQRTGFSCKKKSSKYSTRNNLFYTHKNSNPDSISTKNKTIENTYYTSAHVRLKKLAEKKAFIARSTTRKLVNIFEESASTAYDDSDTVNCIRGAKMQLRLDNYRHKRLQRTARIVEKLDASNPYMLEKLYSFKVNSMLMLREDLHSVKARLRGMLKDPRRMVAKIEKTKHSRMRIHRLRNRKLIHHAKQ